MGTFSCSHQNDQSKNQSKMVLPSIQNNIAPFDLGPTKSNSKIFIDKTKEYGLEGVRGVHLYAVDLNNDGYTDLVVLEDFLSVPKFYIFNPLKKKFELMPNPFEETVRASFLNFVDLDHDGVYDVIVGNLNQKTEMTKYPTRIFKGQIINGEISFKEQEKLPTGIMPTANISVLDYDLDGELDLFFANWFEYSDKGPRPVSNILLKGRGFHFENVTEILEGEQNTKNIAPTFGATVCDIDQNGFPDILTNSSNGYFNKLWLNLDKFNNRKFSDYGEVSGYAADDDGPKATLGGGNSFFSACADYNNDGIIDIAIGNLFRDTDPESKDRSAILTGSSTKFPPKFIRSEFYQDTGKKKWSEGDHRGVFVDYNLSGLESLIVENSGFPPDSRLIFFEQQENHEMIDRAEEFGINIVNPSGLVTLDLKHRGVMDIIVGQTDTRAGNSKSRIYVFENQLDRKSKGSIRFHPQGRLANTHAISGSLFLKTNKHTYFRNIVYNYGSLPSQNEEGPFIGFSDEIPEEVKVNWPISTKDGLNRSIPLVKKYNLKKFKLKGVHHEFNLCEDGRILEHHENCY